MEQLALLEDTIDQTNEKYPNSVHYIRGDANASPLPRNENKRDQLFNFFLTSNFLKSIPTNHHTYHHFMNHGHSDSSIDVLLESEADSEGFPNNNNEKLIKILCKKSNPLIDSSHNALIHPSLSRGSPFPHHPATRISLPKESLQPSIRYLGLKKELLLTRNFFITPSLPSKKTSLVTFFLDLRQFYFN